MLFQVLAFGLLLSGCFASKDSSWNPPEGMKEFMRSWDEHKLHYKAMPHVANESEELIEELSGSLSLPYLLDLVKVRNPKLKAFRSSYQAAKHRILPAQSLEDPMLSIGVFGGDPIETRAGSQQGKIGVSQSFPWPGKLELKGQLAEQQAEIAKEQLGMVEDVILARLKSAYYQYYLANRSIDITQESITLLKNLEKVAETKYTAGKVTQQDVLKAQVEITTLENTLLTLAQRKATAAAMINSLIDRHPEAILGNPSPVSLEVFVMKSQVLYAMAVEHRPELKAALYMIDKSKTSVDLAKKDFFPDFKVGVDYTFTEGGSNPMFRRDGQDAIMATFGINLPFFNKAKRDGNLAAADAEKDAAIDLYRSTANDVLFEVKDNYEKVVASERLARMFKDTIIKQAEQSLDVAITQYESGKVDFLNLLDSERKLLEFNLAYEHALSDYYKNLAELERSVGTELK